MNANLRKLYIILTATLLILVACGPTATPEVIRDFSRANTLTALAQPSATPTGPTFTPTNTSTPYIRPTDPALDLALPLARVGTETITLGQFRARVRYERFAALDEARRLIEAVGLANLNFSVPGQNPAADQLAAIFAGLANTRGFGFQVYDILVRESIIRQEFAARGLTIDPNEELGYWIRRFGVQRDADPRAAVAAPLEAYVQEAMRYSGMTRDEIMNVSIAFQQASELLPLIGRENLPPPSLMQVRLKRIVAVNQPDADAAIAALGAGEEFRAVACRYSILPSTRGNGGDLGFVTRGRVPAGLEGVDSLFSAASGQIVGPLRSPAGWYVFRVSETRRNADGDTEARLQAIVVNGEALAREIVGRLNAGEDFGTLACIYTLDRAASDGGEMGTVGSHTLAPELAQAIGTMTENGLVGPVATANGYEIALVEERTVDIPDPEAVSSATERAFRDWQTARANSSFVNELSTAWRDTIPTDPLPRDVAPYMREENFGLPTPAPTATP